MFHRAMWMVAGKGSVWGGAHQSEMSLLALLCRVVNVQKGKVGWNTPPGRWRLAIWPNGCASYVSVDRDTSTVT